ncbi:poly(ethylene terephthalate) hydrolase family protein [Rhodococcus qingshengii]|uniref:poly(ethylene terephthalate) hydrolase family protein n=1 Tax=Rhodococcus qingshengii TaxID=334542 RepID=UPI002AFF6F8A|nr:alpha/beta hydrolase [Rhodococcus qingshengii]MEA1796876.1 alpha/beta hydrolase [Rhodococcus qingshengii]
MPSRTTYSIAVVTASCVLALSGAVTHATAGVPTTSDVSTTEAGVQQSVSEIFANTGSHEVTEESVTGYQLFYPTDIATTEGRHPVVTFGNGSYATYEEYEALLQHLASWGFVVVVADSSVTGDGTEILGAAQYVVDQNTNAESIFHQRINTDNIASVGHSQGAGGAINAATQSANLITATAVLDLPDPWWASRPVDVIDVAKLTGPTFFMTGADDPVSTADPQAEYFDKTTGPAVRGRLLGVSHNWAADGEGFRGYLTAWLRFTLSGDQTAARAFVGDSAEILTDPHWDRQAIKGL